MVDVYSYDGENDDLHKNIVLKKRLIDKMLLDNVLYMLLVTSTKTSHKYVGLVNQFNIIKSEHKSVMINLNIFNKNIFFYVFQNSISSIFFP